ncbi:ABC transporter substrate-binding protein [Clostridium sp. Ade.TY]|uniref:ABC transporter substrate-binding protein n=1 Tax=Clostridium sp. Ade.TY TaxID=1391647 RepID=UPI000421129C|nr:ABC transporter substrate-binding protein [Clostridium sp. Ade.TY]
MKLRKILSVTLATAIIAGTFVGCGSNNNAPKDSEATKEIYFLNFKPEIAEVYDKIAAEYEKETGVKVKVQTAASGTYEQTLKAEMAKKEAPTIFQINGPVGYQSWKDYCTDLKDTELYKNLMDKSMAITNEDGVYGIPYAVEGYGIIYNNAVMNKYFELADSKAKSMEEINSFEKFKEVTDDMQAKKDKLGIKGVFASTSMSVGNGWRWDTHLANIPLYYEFKDVTAEGKLVLETGLESKKIDFKYSNDFKNIFDLYTTDSATEKGLLSGKTVDDSMAEFALGECAMVQNGNWAWGQIKEVQGNVVKSEDIKFLPIYTGMKGEESQGICVGTENYLAINSKASEEQQKASVDFLNWLFSSDAGKNFVTNDLGFIAPFDTFKDEKPSDPLSKEVLKWMANKDVQNIPWIFQAFPSQAFKDKFSADLLQYVQGSMTWDDVVKSVKETWAAEKN